MKIFVIGSLNMDLVIKAPHMPREGETLTGTGFMANPGGKGANQAVAVAKLGGEAYMVGTVGNAFGEELISALQHYGVKTDYLCRDSEISSGIAVIVVIDGDNRIILDRGANARTDRETVDRAFSQAREGDYLVVQLEIPTETVAYAMKRAKELKMITVLNPAPASELPTSVFAHCDYFTPNQSETEFYTGIYPSDEASARKCAELLAEKGVKNLIITMGGEGSAGVFENRFYHANPVNAGRIVDTTAAGDTYVGAFVVKRSEGASMEEAMAFASKASALTITKQGAQCSIPTRKETDQI